MAALDAWSKSADDYQYKNLHSIHAYIHAYVMYLNRTTAVLVVPLVLPTGTGTTLGNAFCTVLDLVHHVH